MCKEYNGYSNYQTWVISLWLYNDQGTYQEFIGLADELLEDNDIDSATYELMNVLKDYVEDNNPLADTADMYSDLIGHAIANADFYEIAETYFQENN